MKSKYILLGIAFLVLLACFALQIYERTVHPPIYTKSEMFKELLTSEIKGWEWEDAELAATERLQEISENALNYNDHIYRRYTRGGNVVSLYMGYWEPLQMPVRQVGSHTPDVCWVRNGWKYEVGEDLVTLQDGQGRQLKPAMYREYTYNGGNRQYVYFWHLVGNEVFIAKNEPGQWDRMQILTDFFRFGMNQKREQYFIRLQSERPFKLIWEDEGFQELLTSMAETAPLLEGVDPQPVSMQVIRELKDRIREEKEAEDEEESDH